MAAAPRDPGAAGTAALVASLAFAAACGQWSGAPVTDGWQGSVPLGPGPTKTLARGIDALALAADAWGPRLVVAWVERDAAGGTLLVRAAASGDAGADFLPPVVVSSLQGAPPAEVSLRVGVTAPACPGARGAEQVWVRLGGAERLRTGLEWRSPDAGRGFVELPPGEFAPAPAFPGVWTHVDGTAHVPGTRVFSPPDALRYAGLQRVPLPRGATGDPAVVVDDHGALALAWVEVAAEGQASLTVRRAWVDWNGTGGEAPGFDATYRMATLGAGATHHAIARLPGGVAVAWVDRGPDGRGDVLVRRLGLDMTCTRESARPAAP